MWPWLLLNTHQDNGSGPMQKSVGKSQITKCSTCSGAGGTALSGGQTDLVFLQGAAVDAICLQFDLVFA